MSDDDKKMYRAVTDWIGMNVPDTTQVSVGHVCFQIDGGDCVLCAKSILEHDFNLDINNGQPVSLLLKEIEQRAA